MCARALLLVLVEDQPIGDTRIVGAGAESAATASADDDDDDDDDDASPALPGRAGNVDRSADAWVKAREFLQAHLEDLTPRKATTRSRPLPELIELLQIGDTVAFLSGADRLGATLVDLKLPVERVRHACIDALLGWSTLLDEHTPGPVATAAGDAMLVAVAAGQDPFFFS